MRPFFTCLLFVFPLFCLRLAAQGFPCGTDFLHQKALQDPTFYQKNAALQQAADRFFHSKATQERPPSKVGAPEPAAPHALFLGKGGYTIPVVFHLIHQNGPENLSDAQIQQALTWLNEAFANAGTFDRGSGANTGFQFCLAQRTPEGQPTTGITRTVSPLTELDAETEDGALKKLSRWKTNDYVNIWVVREACSITYGCGLTAYAYYPAFHGSPTDGIVIEARWLTAASTISPLAHELGHYFGLAHTFQGGCNNNDCLQDGDYVCDTPPDQSTAGIPCEQTANTCNTDAKSGFSTDQTDPTQNHMDYGPYACMHDFTPGQAERMRFFLEGARKSLLDSKACLPPCPNPVVAALGFADTTVAAGVNFSFPNKSTGAAQYQWTLDGTPIGNQSTANYQFTKPGVYKIVLTALPANPTLCETAKANAIIRVVCDVKADFDVDKRVVKLGTPIQVTNQSVSNLQSTWFINGAAAGNSLSTLLFPSPGQQALKLVVSNGFCRDSQVILITVRDTSTAGCTETSFQQFYPLGPDSNHLTYSQLARLQDGNLIIAANTWKNKLKNAINTYVYKAVFIKKRPDGTQVWEKIMKDDSLSCLVEGVAASMDGGFYAVVLFTKVSGPRSWQLIKCTTDGVQEWSTPLNGSSSPFSPPWTNLLVMPDNSVLVGAQFQENLTLAKFSASGTPLWNRQYDLGVTMFFESMTPVPDGGTLVVCSQSFETFLIRFDAQGGLTWIKSINIVHGTKIVPGIGGNFFIMGGTSANGFAWLSNIRPDGTVIWSKAYTSTANNGPTEFKDLYADPTGLTLVATTKNQRGAFVRLTTDGYPLSLKSYEQENVDLKDLLPTGKGGFWLNGLIRISTPGASTLPYLWLLKTDPTGQAGECNTNAVAISASTWDIVVSPDILREASLAPDPPDWTLPLTPADYKPTTLCDIACATFEICDNNADDDGDGLFDCLDPDCNCPVAPCEPKRNNIWYFGSRNGLDFSTNPPTYLTNGNTQSIYATATMSDERGNLLFYTDGTNVYDRFHAFMPNGMLTPAVSNAPGAECIIVPHPGVKSQYYVFGIGPYVSNGFRYTLVDMRLNNGRGDVVADKKFIGIAPNPINLGLSAIRSCSFEGYWLLVHEFLSNRFFAYAIHKNGIAAAPVISKTGFFDPKLVEVYPQMKLSPDGKRVALAHTRGDIGLEIFDFDPYQTGIVSNPRLIMVPDSQTVRGVEFSPSGQYVYISTQRDKQARVIQYDLEAPDIAASAFVIGEESSGFFYQLQLTPTKEVYVAGRQEYNIGQVFISSSNGAIIHQPNRPGAACEFEANALAFLNTTWCNVIPSDFVSPYVKLGPGSPDTICALGEPQFYRIPKLHCNVDSVHWSMEGVQANILNQYQQAFITYQSYGTGRLIVTAFTQCGQASDTLPILVAAPTSRKLDLGPDRVVCDNGVFTFNAGSGFARYRWNNGLPDSLLTTLLPGKYWVDAWDACGNKQSDTVTVRVAPTTRLQLGPDLSPCKNEALRFERPTVFQHWQWSPNQNMNCDTCQAVTVTPNKPITYTVVATSANGCISVDTLTLSTRDTVVAKVATSICIGRRVVFYGQSLPADTVAVFFRPAPSGVGCDSLVTISVSSQPTPQQRLEVSVCPGQFYSYRGQALPPDTTAIFFHPSGTLACDTVVTVVTESYPPMVLSILPQDTTIFVGASVALSAQVTGTGPFQYTWTPAETLGCDDCPAPTANPVDTILYRLVATDANQCSSTATAQVNVKDICIDMIPNAFTPNDDDTNDRFYPFTQPCVKKVLRWTVVNRWGQTVFERSNFEPNKPDLGWDGNAHGQAQPMDGYVWFAEFELYNGKKVFKKGSVTLLR